MKKFILLITIISIFGCKNSEKNETESTTTVDTTNQTIQAKPACIDLSDYNKLSDQKDKVNWLKSNGKNVCSDILKEKVKKEHTVTSLSDFILMYDPSKPATKYSWNEIKNIIGTNQFYDNWINCKIDSKNNVILSMGDFTDLNSCYSIPLLENIANEELDPSEYNDKLFVFKINTNRNKVVFTVKNNYNYSQQPTFHIGKFNIL
jgi:hypothetical protein